MLTATPSTPNNLKVAAEKLICGNLVAFPTETVYGIGADAQNERAITKLYLAKGRPLGHPVIVHLSSIELVDMWVKMIPHYAETLAKTFWPGPMTLILNRSHLAKNFITGSQDCVGIRVPSHPIAQRLLKEFEAIGGLGLAAPSANKFGAVSPTSALDVLDELKDRLLPEDVVLDGGTSTVGLESTIIDCTKSEPSILRPGAITFHMIENLLGVACNVHYFKNDNSISAPGMLDSHYAPNANVFLKGVPKSGEGYIALSCFKTPNGAIRLANPKNNKQFARVLYKSLRLADELKIKNVFVVPPRGQGIAVAINDRLNKCASKNY
jgi:L-threonylcarbamoyladenylate synthase